MRRPRISAVLVAVIGACALLSACTASSSTAARMEASAHLVAPTSSPSSGPPTTATAPASSAAPTVSPAPTPSRKPAQAAGCLRTVTVGWSVRHRLISACERGTPGGVSLVVIGNIHGDERIGWRVIDRLARSPVPAGVDLWLIRSVNPDGSAAGTRGNAHGVDENRNFPAGWAPSNSGTSTYGGPAPLSEPETTALARWLRTLRPRTVVVIHSPLNAVDFSDGAVPAVTRYLAAASGFAARRLGSRPGAFTGWFNAQPWGGTAVTFEFARTATAGQVDRVAAGLLRLARWRAQAG